MIEAGRASWLAFLSLASAWAAAVAGTAVLPLSAAAFAIGASTGAPAAATLAGGASPLTARERDVLVASRDGAAVAEVAGRLFLSEGTVRNYLSAAIGKTGTRNRVEALRTAEAKGWL